MAGVHVCFLRRIILIEGSECSIFILSMVRIIVRTDIMCGRVVFLGITAGRLG